MGKNQIFEDITEIYIWKKFKKYNRLRSFFIFIMGLFSGIITGIICWMV